MQTLTDNQFIEPAILDEANSPITTVRCIECGAEFQAKGRLLLDRIIMPSGCDDCANIRDARICEWVQLCPFEFRLHRQEGGGNTRLEKMDADQPGWRRIFDWKFGHRGLLVRGETGQCKTRAMWRLLRQLFGERRKVVARTSAHFDRECRDAGGNFTLSDWFKRLAEVDVLFLDDLGKARWTEGTEAQIFDLIDIRTREGRPILATTNDTGTSLAARLSPDRGEPLIRRLRDYCETIVFSPAHQPTSSTRQPYAD
jgi:hypothetical protein